MPNGKYTLRKKNEERNEDLDKTYGTLIADILYSRGVSDIKLAQKHLHDKLGDVHDDPLKLGEMGKALDRINKAIEKNEHITIHADYDCDGIPGAVILTSLFKEIGFTNYTVSIPNRNIEGYGLNIEHVKKFVNTNTKLIITIDLGITGFEAIEEANILGMDTIITDHHTIPEKIPQAYAIVHPKIFNSNYENKELCGAGVVYTLVRGFINEYGTQYSIPNNFIDSVVDMAAFATLSDMVELTPENKAIIKEGLNKIRSGSRPGLLALAKSARVYLRDLTQDDLTFMLAPKLNVASRMGNPHDAYNLLMEKDFALASVLSDALTNLSNERRKIVALMVKEARRDIAKFDKDQKDVIVIGHPAWKVGLLGLVASKIVEIYGRPTFVWGRTEDEDNIVYKGSCRGNNTVNVYEIMASSPMETFLEFGGHFEAGGFSVSQEKIYDLENNLIKGYAKVGEDVTNITASVAYIDAVLPISLLHPRLHSSIFKLAPFGSGFTEPVFVFKNTEIVDIRNFGTGNAHIEITFKDTNGLTASAYAFYTKGADLGSPVVGNTVHIVGTLDAKLWQGTVRVRLKDIIISGI